MVESLLMDGLVVRARDRDLVHGVSLQVRRGELTGLVGASGSGKTLTCRSLLGLVDVHPGVVDGELTIPTPEGPAHPYRSCLGAPRRVRDRAFRGIRGRVVGYLRQNAPATLDPLLAVGRQVSAAAALAAAEGGDRSRDPIQWMVQAGFPEEDAAAVSHLFPHELSGGMAQRVAIAQLLARGSTFVVADEPMTGLDATLQRRLVKGLRRHADNGLGVLVVTHDLRLLRGVVDIVHLMDAGRIVETWTREQFERGEPDTDAGRRLITASRRRAW
ncbi:MAG: ATP-binding cassette domain-containing protein [Myxococcales bacterium]|nr:ATP-binding cassette domain-containing protein [Myxococcales bacterium]